ncbi:GNAT family N-acetyltransferase [Alkalicoccus luteus]|uniref:GNAT family N-acetyltransferase n=1 Tax=Alkalicoccus luteus TaxID=1237094 RepID=A0A969PL62_9BACI|nr:GNAT family N-acetyltransferase [Alkalicoccus luteus]NJP36215.1 GNAT family N-acetyltransferase [Alkalicoccus luteus]
MKIQLTEEVDEALLARLEPLYQHMFSDIRTLQEKAAAKPALHVTAAWDHEALIGFKIGYRTGATTFYSWLGAVDPDRRRAGVGSALMRGQHEALRKLGYTSVCMKTMNRWRGMLILALQHDFLIIGTEEGEKGVKIVLEKALTERQ